MKYLKFCIWMLAVLVAPVAYGQQTKKVAAIKGKVANSKGEAVSFAHIAVENLSIGTIAGEDGVFLLDYVPFGDVTLQVSAIGYEAVRRTMKIRDTLVTIGIELTEGSNALKEVVVKGENVSRETRELKESGYSVTALDTRKLRNTTLDINQALNMSSGIRIRESGGMGSDFNFSINGLSGRAIKFFVDGIPMESFGSALSLNNVPMNLVERVEVYKGVVPASLGSDAMGGAVNIITNQKLKRYLDASYAFGSFNTHKAALSGGYRHEPTGFTVKANAYYNYSDNNYLMRNNPGAGVSIEVVEGNLFVQRNQRRFHDAYESLMGQMEAGWTDRKWADALLLGFVTSRQFNEMQTGASLEYVIGNVTNRQTFAMPALKYRKEDLFVKGLSLTLFGSAGLENSVVADTSSLAVYDWAGKPGKTNATGELGGGKSWFRYRNINRVGRINIGYRIDKIQSFNFNINSSITSRQGRDQYRSPGSSTAGDDPNMFEKPNEVRRNVVGLAYEINLLDSRWTNTLFGKHYGYNLKSYNVTSVVTTGLQIVKKDTSTSSAYIGYGIASRYRFSESSGIKASFERAYRLPESMEVFGDGMQVLANIGIRPEESDNLNLGGYSFNDWKGHRVSFEGGLFYRNAKNFIFSTPVGRFSTYKNVGFTRIYGVEADARYSYNNLFSLSLNGSYNHQVDAQRFLENSRQENRTYQNRVPNIPYFFGNAEFSIGRDRLFGEVDGRLDFRWSTQYVHWYYLTWEAFGSNRTKSTIPSQLLHHAALSYSIAGGQYNVSLESRNLTNALAYDHFKLQKPGRSVYIKLRYFIR